MQPAPPAHSQPQPQPQGTAPPRGGDAALGFRRVEYVRVVVGEGRPYGEVSGIAHRYPRTVRVSVATANRLAEAGVPTWIEDRRSDHDSGRR